MTNKFPNITMCCRNRRHYAIGRSSKLKGAGLVLACFAGNVPKQTRLIATRAGLWKTFSRSIDYSDRLDQQ